jgi:hypothetical protein
MLQAELDAKDASALAARGPHGIGYGLDICSRDVTHAQLQATLQGLFDAGSQPLIQGYFRRYDTSTGVHYIRVVITGWTGAVPQPTPDPDWNCINWSTKPAAWLMLKHPSEPDTAWRWGDWASSTPYEEFIELISVGWAGARTM